MSESIKARQPITNHSGISFQHPNPSLVNTDKISTSQDKLIESNLVQLPISPKPEANTNSFKNLKAVHEKSNREENGLEDIPTIAADVLIEGKRGRKVNLGLPPKPEHLRMNNKLWAVLYGYSVRLVVRDQSPRREYIKTMLNIKTDVAQILIQFMETRGIISPYKGPNAPRQIYVTLEQVEFVYPELFFAMNNYANMSST